MPKVHSHLAGRDIEVPDRPPAEDVHEVLAAVRIALASAEAKLEVADAQASKAPVRYSVTVTERDGDGLIRRLSIDPVLPPGYSHV